MQCGKNQHAHCCAIECQADGFHIAHFANQNDIGVGAHRTLESGAERARVLAHFTMNNGTVFIVMSKFDRVFERDNLLLRGFVDVVDDGRERR